MDSVVALAEPLIVPLTEGVPSAVVNPTEPPVVTEPDTTRNALSLWVVDFVQPVGAAVCTNNITVPDGANVVAAVDCVVASPKVMPAEVSIAI